MKTIFAAATLLILTLPATVSANDPQSGTGGECVNDLITFVQNQGLDLGISVVSVERGTAFAVTSTAAITYVDFFSNSGQWVGWDAGAGAGVVPGNAAYGVICPTLITDPVLGAGLVADPTAAWTYQDGL